MCASRQLWRSEERQLRIMQKYMDKEAHFTNMASVSNLQWKDTLDSLSNDFLVFKGWILKQPPLKSSGLHTLVL